MPGTSDDPVRLDPFQNIIGVGWRNDPPTHVAVAIGITTWVHWISANSYPVLRRYERRG